MEDVLMIEQLKGGHIYKNNTFIKSNDTKNRNKTITYNILKAHNHGANMDNLKIKFDALASHDITYVGIIQTARASGMEKFPLPYVLTNCHNSLCAVGGTINEDDHVFGLSAAKKYGGIYVPAHQAVIHQYMREQMVTSGGMILGSDSHTRYGAYGTMGIGEGGPELVKQLCGRTYDIIYPEVIAVYLDGKPKKGVGPQDIALTIIKNVFANGFVKNKVMEFIGPGIKNLTIDFRSGIDVMTTETTCLSSIWETDEKTKEWYEIHQRVDQFQPLMVEKEAYYDGVLMIDLSTIEPMIALPFHPSNAYTIEEFLNNAEELLEDVEKEAIKIFGNATRLPPLQSKLSDGDFYVDQSVIAGCSGGTYENVVIANAILNQQAISNDAFTLSVYPASQPQMAALMQQGSIMNLIQSGASIRSAICGPCFGAGDVPSNGGFSIRHTTRNFPNREGSKPNNQQMAYVALMDARSIAATAKNGGKLTPATKIEYQEPNLKYHYDPKIYQNRVYNGWGKASLSQELIFGPNITDWPKMIALPESLLLEVASALYDAVTTTDELIPSGETSSYRSNPLGLAEFTLSRTDPNYVPNAKANHLLEINRRNNILSEEVKEYFRCLKNPDFINTGIGSLIFALKPGDGSAREQAASCQRVLGGCANIVEEYATKRYRSNVVNWGMLPFVLTDAKKYGIQSGDKVYLPNIRTALINFHQDIKAVLIRENGEQKELILSLPDMSEDERDIILEGCLINYYAAQNK